MYRFWDAIIQPVLEALQPKTIVEIGSDYGPNTRKLLEFSRRRGATLHVIDPLPKYDVAAWQEEYGEHLVFHRALSLEALPGIDGFDVVLIDGDHNWYTVFNELELIEDRCKALSQPFPLVMFHDVCWPYGRRDSYYNPDDIPDEYLKPHERKGLRPGVAELVEDGGLNRNFDNAVSENDSRNGVLTAIEDFLNETEQEIEPVLVPGLHGLGILVPLQLKERNAELAAFLEVLDMPPALSRYVQVIEDARLEAEIERQEQKARSRRLKTRNEKLLVQNQRLQRKLDERKQRESQGLLDVLRQVRSKVLGK